MLLSKIKRNRMRNIFYSKTCRYCNSNLDGGDIFEILSQNEEYKTLSHEQILEIAWHYGYTIDNPIHFSKEIIVQFKDKAQITICPFCNGIWPTDNKMSKEYYSGNLPDLNMQL